MTKIVSVCSLVLVALLAPVGAGPSSRENEETLIKKAVEDDMLSLHGLWNNISDGGLEAYDSDSGQFVAF